MAWGALAVAGALLVLEGVSRLVDRQLGNPLAQFDVPVYDEKAYLAYYDRGYPYPGERQPGRSFAEALSRARHQAQQGPTFRVVGFGGSAAAGFSLPSQSAFTFALQRILEASDARVRYEVANEAEPGENSCRVLARLRNALAGRVDLAIVYLGNNELHRWCYPALYRNRLPWVRRIQRGLRQSRLYRWMLFGVLVARGPGGFFRPREYERNHWYDMDYCEAHPFRGLSRFDPRWWPKIKRWHLGRLRQNLRAMAAEAQRRDTVLMFCTAPVNLRLCPCAKEEQPETISPLSTEERARFRQHVLRGDQLRKAWELAAAAREYERAAKIDPLAARPRYRLAQCCEALGRIDAARREYLASRENMVGYLGAIRSINQTILAVARETGAPSVDLMTAFFRKSERCGIGLGTELMLDPCHPTIEGHELIAQQVADRMKGLGLLRQRDKTHSAGTRP